jgi:EmrB/QacA subfamily drug resistance transporter
MAHPERRLPILAVVAVGVFLSTLDSSMVNIALPAIMHAFHCTLYSTEWVVLVYLLTVTVLLIFWGHLGDRIGRRRIYAFGMLIFGVSSFLCGIAPGIAFLIAYRFTQAVGASMMMSSGPALIREFFPAARLGRNLGLVGIAVSLGLMTGPSLGGFLIEYLSWRAIFFITAPVGLLFSLLALQVLPEVSRKVRQQPFDITGSLAWGASVCIALLVLAHPPSGWKPLLFFIVAAIGLSIFSFFIRHETRIANPLFPLHLFKERFFSIAVLCSLLSFSVLFSVTLLIPFYLDRILGLTASRIGMTMMALPLSVLVVAPVSGWLSDHIGARYLTTLGLLTSTGSLLLLTRIGVQTSSFDVAWRLSLLGFGQAMFLAPNSASVLANVRNSVAGVSAGILATARNFGMLFGIALAGMFFSLVYQKSSGGLEFKDFTADQAMAFMTALRATFFMVAGIGAAAVIFSWLRGTGLKKTRRGIN